MAGLVTTGAVDVASELGLGRRGWRGVNPATAALGRLLPVAAVFVPGVSVVPHNQMVGASFD